jgi:hypothetical protein
MALGGWTWRFAARISLHSSGGWTKQECSRGFLLDIEGFYSSLFSVTSADASPARFRCLEACNCGISLSPAARLRAKMLQTLHEVITRRQKYFSCLFYRS